MKRIIQPLIILVIILILAVNVGKPVWSYVSKLVYSSPCDDPIHYQINEVDKQFNLSRDAFLTDIGQAATIWDDVQGKQLFVYDPQGQLSISLVFDQRQSLNNQIDQLQNQLDTEKNSIKPEISQYQSLSQDFKQRLTSLNSQIEYWNSKGGAPPTEYNTLTQEQKDLQAEANRLNTMAKDLNQSTDVYNAQVGQLNQTVYTYNSALQLRPEEGIYDPNNDSINIYFDISQNELIHTLAHELGHSLGLGHNANPQSIMFPKTTQKITPSLDDILALQKICQKKNIFQKIGDKIQILLQKGK